MILFFANYSERFGCDASHLYLLIVMEYDLSVPLARDPLIVIAVFAFIAILSTGLRLESRRIRQIPLARDDYLIVAALVGMIPRAVFSSKQLRFG